MAHPKILLLYSSVYGLSRTICQTLHKHLASLGVDSHVAAIADVHVDPAPYDAIVVGASIRQGKHNPAVIAFIERHLALLQTRPGALFSVNLVARKAGKNTPETNPYLQRFLARCPWRPQLLGVFAGELDYSRYGPIEKQMMRFVMMINKGPTDPSTKVQFTDWAEVERWAGRLAALVQRPGGAEGRAGTTPAQAGVAAAAIPA